MNNDELHIPVLTDQLVGLINPTPGSVGVDCTLGLGGHAVAMIQACGEDVKLIGLDVDPQAIEVAAQRLDDYAQSITIVKGNFADIANVLSEMEVEAVDFIYADLGTSGLQLADAERGFSFAADGPLDMRLDPSLTTKAVDIVNGTKETALADLIFRYGDENRSRKIAEMICKARRDRRIDSTRQLAEIVCHALGKDINRIKPGRIHPATKTFQALRIAVNNELGQLERLLNSVPRLLKTSGRFAVISFHSLEDRMVKQNFRVNADEGVYNVLTKKPICPEPSELIRNPRARSAKLRVAEKVS